jgi:hypothetical protein
MHLKIKEKITNPLTQINLIDDDFGITLELLLLLAISKRKFVVFWNLLFIKKKIGKKIHNMFFFNANP